MVFFDTNVLVYAAFMQDMRKKHIAATLLEHAEARGDGVISLQVLREFANALYRKSDCSPRQVMELVRGYRDAFPCIGDSAKQLFRGMEIKERYGLQFYDALVIAAAEEAGCDIVYSGDMADGAVYGAVSVKNPFG